MTQRPHKDLSKLQAGMAIASFASGVLIASVCLFIVPPPGEIAASAISIVSKLLVLCGGLLGIKANYDIKLRKFQAEIDDIARKESALESQAHNNA